MSCLHVHDFITGTTIALPRGNTSMVGEGGIHDIVRPNGQAAALVSDHLARLSELAGGRATAPQTSRVTAAAS